MLLTQFLHRINRLFTTVNQNENDVTDKQELKSSSADIVLAYELFRDIHYAELQRKDGIAQQLAFPFGVVIALATAALYCLKSAIHSDQSIFTIALQYMSIIILIPLVAATVYLALAYHSKTAYKYLPHTKDLDNHIQKLRDWASNLEGSCEDNVERNVRQNMIRYFADCADSNSRLNDRKSQYLHKAKLIVLITTILILPESYLAYKVELTNNNIQKVMIVPINSKGGELSNGRGNERAKSSNSASTPTSTPAPANPGNKRGSETGKTSENRKKEIADTPEHQ